MVFDVGRFVCFAYDQLFLNKWRDMKKLAIFGALILLTLGNTAQADQTGDCTQGTEFCESLETTNTTTTTN